uniref:CS domain-containing protein n=1 Tax=Trichuris muris TaxID=70415 RepID=A0A5S6QS35_TRIMR
MSNLSYNFAFPTCTTPWGQWWQTVGEVNIEVGLPEPVRASRIDARILPTKIAFSIDGKVLLEGELFAPVHVEESVWTLEDGKTLRIMLSKSTSSQNKCWRSLFADGSHAPDAVIYDRMEKCLVLERFQVDNPAMDFSDAELSGNYHDGGPDLPS